MRWVLILLLASCTGTRVEPWISGTYGVQDGIGVDWMDSGDRLMTEHQPGWSVQVGMRLVSIERSFVGLPLVARGTSPDLPRDNPGPIPERPRSDGIQGKAASFLERVGKTEFSWQSVAVLGLLAWILAPIVRRRLHRGRSRG